jgi:DNA modification methylase
MFNTTIRIIGGSVKEDFCGTNDSSCESGIINNIARSSLFTENKTISDFFSEKSDIVFALGDSLETLKSCPSGFAKMIISSPPYNIGKEYETQQKLEQYLDGLLPILTQLVRVMSPSGSLCWQVGNYVEDGEIYPLDMYFYSVFKKLGLKLRNRIIWTFGHGLHCSKRFSGRYETLLWFTKTNSYTFNLDSVRVTSKYPGKTNFKPGSKYGLPSGNPLGKNPSDIWEFMGQEWENGLWNIPNVKANHPEKTIHPCQFPIELAERCVLAMTDEGDWVLDPFSGVGSAMLAAVKLNRKAMGCDKEETYIIEAKKRMELLFSGNLKYRPLGKPVYQPTGKEKVSQIPKQWLKNKEVK